MSLALSGQLQAYRETVRQASERRGDDLGTELEILIDLGISFFETIKATVDRENERAELSGGVIPESVARALVAAYRELGDTFARIATLVDRIDDLGGLVSNLERFRAAHVELRELLSIDYDRVRRADAGLRAGRSRSATEVRDAVRGQVFRRG